MKKVYSLVLKISVGIIILFFLFKQVGVRQVLEILKGFNLYFLLPSAFFYSLSLLLAAVNIWLLIRSIGKAIPFLRLFKKYLLSWSIGLFFPGKLGDFSIVYFLKKDGVSIGESSVITILDKLISMISLFLFSISGFFIFFEFSSALKIIAIIVFGIAIFMFMLTNNFFRGLIKRLILRKHAKKLKGFSKTLFYLFKRKKNLLFINYVITVAKWGSAFWFTYLLFLALGTSVGFFKVLLVISVVKLVASVPITIGGLGVREVTGVYLFEFYNIDPSVSLSVFTLMLLFYYVSALLSLVFIRFDHKVIS